MADDSNKFLFLFLDQLQSDGDLQAKFKEDPKAAMAEHNVPEEHQEALALGKKFSFSFCPETHKNDSDDDGFSFLFL